MTSLLAAQIETFGQAKDWIVLMLVGVVGTLLGAAWGDLRGKFARMEERLDGKAAADQAVVERLARCEEQIKALLAGRRGSD